MNAETRQTLIGVGGMTLVVVVALAEGFNGRVTAAYMVSVLAIIAPETLDKVLPWFNK